MNPFPAGPSPGGAVARQGPLKAIIANNLNTRGAVDLELPDGQRLVMSVVGLGYWDGAIGKAVLIAEVQDCVGRISAATPNEVWFDDAFRSESGFRASVRYRYTKEGLEQDILILERPPVPEDLPVAPGQPSLSSRTSKLQVITEVHSGPTPTKLPGQVASPDGTVQVSEDIDFGSLRLVQGQSFRLGDENGKTSVPVTKEYLQLNGRAVIIEEIPIPAIAHELDQLPVPPPRPEPEGKQGAAVRPAIRTADGRVSLPARRLARNDRTPMMTAQVNVPTEGLLVDWVGISTAGYTNYVFKSDTTYYLSGTANLYSTTVLEGGTVLKATNTSAATLVLNGPLVCQTTPYRPVVFTSKDDNSIGQTISGSTGSPGTCSAVTFLNAGSQDNTYKYLRFAYGGKAVSGASFTNGFWHCQFVNCGTNVNVTGSSGLARFYNALASKCETVVAGDCTLIGEHVTADQCNRFASTAVTSGVLTNSILTAVTNLGNVTLYDSAQFTSKAGVYQTVSAGDYYLVAVSTNRNVGTANVNSTLLADLRQRTTEPPLLWTNAITTATIWSPQVQRDTDIPDRGWHYDALDYLVSYIPVSASLTLTNGVAVGLSGTYGFNLSGSTPAIYSTGTPGRLNRICWYPAVQEQPVKINNVSTAASALIKLETTVSTPIKLRFTDLPMQGLPQKFFETAFVADQLDLTVQDSQLRGIDLNIGYNFNDGWSAVTLQNNLVERSMVDLYNGAVVMYYGEGEEDYNIYQAHLDLTLYNNLFWRSTLTLFYGANSQTYPPMWVVKDNLFDTATISYSGNGSYSSYLSSGNNGFYSTSNPFGGSGNVTVTSLAYATGALGPWYLGSVSPTLIDAGSREAKAAGLYHYTTQTSEVKEGDNTSDSTDVDIGYHYVATGPDTANLVGLWLLDDASGTTASDSSGQGNNGTLQNSPTWTGGQIGSGALSFDGSDDYVNLGTDFGKPSTLTIGLWFKTSSLNGEGAFGQANGVPPNSIAAYVTPIGITTSGDVRAEQWIGFVSSVTTSGYNYADNHWHHAALVGVSGSGYTLYVDGNAIGFQSGTIDQSWWSQSFVGTSFDSRAPLGGSGSWRYFGGAIDDVRLYSRALSTGEVQLLASKNTSPRDTDGDGIADYWEDTNGNGTKQTGETDWTSSENGTTGATGLQVFTVLE